MYIRVNDVNIFFPQKEKNTQKRQDSKYENKTEK